MAIVNQGPAARSNYPSNGIQSIRRSGAGGTFGSEDAVEIATALDLEITLNGPLSKGVFVVTSSSSSPEPSLRRHGPSLCSSL